MPVFGDEAIHLRDDEEGRDCEELIQKMVSLFGISEAEALGRLNRAWKDKPLLGEHSLVYHRSAEYWANRIYYGDDSQWSQHSAGLRPLPYP